MDFTGRPVWFQSFRRKWCLLPWLSKTLIACAMILVCAAMFVGISRLLSYTAMNLNGEPPQELLVGMNPHLNDVYHRVPRP